MFSEIHVGDSNLLRKPVNFTRTIIPSGPTLFSFQTSTLIMSNTKLWMTLRFSTQFFFSLQTNKHSTSQMVFPFLLHLHRIWSSRNRNFRRTISQKSPWIASSKPFCTMMSSTSIELTEQKFRVYDFQKISPITSVFKVFASQ